MKTIALAAFFFFFVAIPNSFADGGRIMAVDNEEACLSIENGKLIYSVVCDEKNPSDSWIDFYRNGFMNQKAQTCINFEPGKDDPTLKACDRYSKTQAKAIGDPEKIFSIGLGKKCLAGWMGPKGGVLMIDNCSKDAPDQLWKRPWAEVGTKTEEAAKTSANPEIMGKLKGKWKKAGPRGGMIEFKDGKKTTYENNKVLESAPFTLVNPCKIMVHDGQEEREFTQTSELGIIKIKNECYGIQGLDDKSLSLMYMTTDGDPMPEHYIKAQVFSSVKAIDTKMLEGQWKAPGEEFVFDIDANRITDCCSEAPSWCEGKFIGDEAFCYQVLSVDQQELFLFAYGPRAYFDKLTRIEGSASKSNSTSAGLMAKLQGQWRDVDDSHIMEFKGALIAEHFGAEKGVFGKVATMTNCAKSGGKPNPNGPYLQEVGLDTCYTVEKATDSELEMTNIGGGYTLRFKRIDATVSKAASTPTTRGEGNADQLTGTAAKTAADPALMGKLNGKWKNAAEYTKEMIEFKDGKKTTYENNKVTGSGSFTLVNSCKFVSDGEEGEFEDTLEASKHGIIKTKESCWDIQKLDDKSLRLWYMIWSDDNQPHDYIKVEDFSPKKKAKAQSVKKKKSPAPKKVEESVWQTNFGGLVISNINEDAIKGQYEGGRISGKRNSSVLAGEWYQKTNRKCAKQKNGDYYWGKFKFNFKKKDEFKGVWSYCDDSENQGEWNGKLVKGKGLNIK